MDRIHPYYSRFKRFCPRGHDKEAVGLNTQAGCRACSKITSKEGNWKAYGIKNDSGGFFTTTDYDRNYQIQQGKCIGCGKHQSCLKKVLVVDHDHITGLFRGLLCDPCNRILGDAEENSATLLNLAEYCKKKK